MLQWLHLSIRRCWGRIDFPLQQPLGTGGGVRDGVGVHCRHWLNNTSPTQKWFQSARGPSTRLNVKLLSRHCDKRQLAAHKSEPVIDRVWARFNKSFQISTLATPTWVSFVAPQQQETKRSNDRVDALKRENIAVLSQLDGTHACYSASSACLSTIPS